MVVLINFWATWCAPCIKEMTFLDRLQGDLKGEPLHVLTISEDQGGIAVAKAFLARQKFTFLHAYADPGGAMADALKVGGLPTSFVLDKQGRLVNRVEGPYEWDNPKIVAKFRELMKE
jgi:thiol-disulfide isomerase/thioredoxin